MDTFGINISDFNLKPEFFDHKTSIHGIDHTYRVMSNVLKLGSAIDYPQETRLAFFAAYIHDMARKHDGKCSEHGKWSADEKLSFYLPLFKKNGLLDNDIPVLYFATSQHSLAVDPIKTHPYFIPTAILKDADALDRIRIHRFDLKLKYLRFEESKKLVSYAEDLFHNTRNAGFTVFQQYYDYLCKNKN